ncbi:ligase-associated DNA damage response endonuclease PdeM [Pulveribacter sp.]|uniref:ligase-associated DNA damage response endonuclease PdeM n=1 Tax=Pulveribacter sp. TaxID=2678893 RepID=UPI0028A687A4|nr:ligase-associated DNA damage response endonuclease PdeM [Pulveribacter sp.]
MQDPRLYIRAAPGADLVPLPEHALWWPLARTLFVADVHLGKAATFRARGLPVPAGTTAANLARLSALITGLGAERLIVLGDFLHAAEAQTPALLAQLAQWRGHHAAVGMTLVRGNHDRHAGEPPPHLRIAVVDEPHVPYPGIALACCHHPQQLAGHTVLAGHVHPAVLLHGRGRDALRLPAFCHDPGLVLLPAFGDFTGAHTLGGGVSRQLYAVGGDKVWKLPAYT